MCLILFSFQPEAEVSLVLAANRDEFFARPTAAARFWEDTPDILAGQDLVGGGTWLGITKQGRFAAITNVREPDVVVENPLSRGELTKNFLCSEQSPEDYLNAIADNQMRYSGFNLLVGELTGTNPSLYYSSNRKEGVQKLPGGTYGLSNHLLNSNWPKVDNGKHFINESINTDGDIRDYHHQLRAFLENPSVAKDEDLPSTGVSYEREKALSASFISLPDYGTRTSTVLTVKGQEIAFSEKNYPTEDRASLGDEYTLFTIESR